MISACTRLSPQAPFKQWGIIAVLILGTIATACGGGSATNTSAPAVTATAIPTKAAAATTAPVTAAPATAVPTTSAAAPATQPALSTAAASASTQTKLTGAPVPLVVYSAQGQDKDIVDAFQKTTGIPTKLVDDSTGPLLAKIQAEKNNPQWGLLWVDGAEAFAALDQDGQLVKGYTPQVPYTDLGKPLVPKDGSFIPMGVTMAGTIVYDTRTVPNPPTSWQDLLKPEWKGAVGMNNPAISGPTYPFVAGMMNYLGGEDQGKQFYTQLKGNGLHVYKTNKVTLQALQSGEIKIAIIQSSAGIAAGLKTSTIKVGFLPKVSVLPSNIGINAKAPAQEQTEAKMFAEFVLSAQGQKIMQQSDATGDSLYWPIVSGVEPLAALPPLSSIPTQFVDPFVWGPKENEINQWFTDNIAQ